MVKRLPAVQETQVRSLGREIPWRRKWQPTPVLLPGKFHGLRGSSEPGRLQSMGSQRVGHDWATSLSNQSMRVHIVSHTWPRLLSSVFWILTILINRCVMIPCLICISLMTNDAENLFYFYFKVDLLFIMWLLDWDSYKKQRWRYQKSR